ncbi:glycosyltransferase family 1 protein [Aureobasidium pullulans]|uniref:Glycosyltransferase family 1 protein n=1 Tax=Aureobasidium pullulans TaxID=5580 RepID=A0A4V4J8R8_AURPU|nr:glycosyltransferase family 1 protein [Aureobasidium pullulans]THX41168.1 glycosyltransferase family 1 protein [Aureobasidium pullulans]
MSAHSSIFLFIANRINHNLNTPPSSNSPMDSKRTTTGAYQPSSGNQDGLNWDAPPAYKFEGHSNDGSVSAKITDDGRFNIGIKTKLSAVPGYDIEKLVTNQTPQRVVANTPGRVPPLNIVIQIVGSRGDVQPFIALGQRLQSSGHRIRIATHGEFEDCVRSTGLEFYNIGGNAAHLMAYMVKNPSIFPSFATMKSGEIGRKRKMVYEMLNGCWRSCISVCGFFSREEKPYTPDRELDAFLRAGPRPIYIGFGSIVMENPENMTDLIISAVKACRVRAIVSKGWSKLGAGRSDKDILFLGDCPHEWLFKHVAGVIHHGGAGTTACGLLNGRPTGIVPFFGDQPFWGNMVAVAGAGPKPIHHKELNSENLAAMIRKCLEPATLQAAADIARRMSHERGVDAAAESFFRNLPAQAMTCDIINGQKASWVWSDEQSNKLKLSDLALHTLVEHGKIKIEDTNVYEPYPITIENQRWDPLTAGGSAIMGAAVDVLTAVSGLFFGLKSEFKQSNGSRDESGDRRAARVAIKTSRSVAEIGGVAVKASLVDYPMALVDGLDGIPALLGGKTRRFEPVTDWRSGGRVACKKFGMGFVDAFANLAMHPIRGAKNEGFAGFMKGIPAGAFGFVTTPAAGIFGLVAYPAQGVYKSIKTMYNPDRQEILFARQVHGAYLNTRYKLGPEQVAIVLSAFDATRATLRRGRKKNKK